MWGGTISINADSFSIYIILKLIVATYKFIDKNDEEISEVNKTEKYNVTYNLNGGSGIQPTDNVDYAPGSEADIKSINGINSPNDTPYFLGWEYNAKVYYPGDKIEIIDKNIELKALWGKKEPVTSLIYTSNGDDGLDKKIILKNNALETVKSIDEAGFSAPNGYLFLGWNKSADGSSDYYYPGNQIRADINNSTLNKLYAIWVKLYADGGSWIYDGQNHSITNVRVVTSDGQIIGGYNFLYSIDGGNSFDNTLPSIKNAGEINVKVKAISNGLTTLEKEVKLEVRKKEVVLKTDGSTKEYDGKSLVNQSGRIEGLISGENVTVNTKGSQTEVGSSDNDADINWSSVNKDNYSLKKELGKLIVNKNTKKIKLVAPSISKEYDGTQLIASSEVLATGLPDGFSIVASAEGSITNAGSVESVVKDGYKILDMNGNDKTDNFTNIETTKGSLEIIKKALIVKTGSAEKEYDGTPLVKNESSITGLVPGESATIVANGTITEIGETDNTYRITWGSAKESNYQVTQGDLGKLKIITNSTSNQVIIKASSKIKEYDGSPLTSSEISFKNLPTGFKVVGEAEATITNVGKVVNKVKAVYKILNQNNEDKTANFTNIRVVDGELEITKAPLSITTSNAEKVYNGLPLTKTDGVSIVGLKNNETVTVTTTGSITDVGEKDNTYTMTWENANPNNYTVVANLGKLIVREYTGKITVTAVGGEWVYDGQEHSATVNVSPLPTGYILRSALSNDKIKNVTEGVKVANCDNLVIVNAAGVDVTANLTGIKYVDATLKITPRELKVITPNAEKFEDGTPLAADGRVEGLIVGEEVTFTTTGSQTIVGSSVNIYNLVWDKTAIETNYTVVEILGNLTVKQKPSQSITPDKYLVRFLDCNRNTVKLEWVLPNTNADVPNGYGEYSGYTNVDSSRDLKPISCKVENSNNSSNVKYKVPNTRNENNLIWYIIILFNSFILFIVLMVKNRKHKLKKTIDI